MMPLFFLACPWVLLNTVWKWALPPISCFVQLKPWTLSRHITQKAEPSNYIWLHIPGLFSTGWMFVTLPASRTASVISTSRYNNFSPAYAQQLDLFTFGNYQCWVVQALVHLWTLPEAFGSLDPMLQQPAFRDFISSLWTDSPWQMAAQPPCQQFPLWSCLHFGVHDPRIALSATKQKSCLICINSWTWTWLLWQ